VNIQIRGISSISGTQPLVIIDGVHGNLDRLNPNDIASIEVLKDASSAAIYGATGGNGVILVTTKNGSVGKMKVNASVYRGFENPVGRIEVMNSQEYMELIEEVEATKKVPINYQPDTLKTYDWQEMMFQQAISENYNISVSGGNEVSTFLFSTSFDKQNGILKNTDYQRFTARINAEQKVNNFIRFDQKVTYINTVTEGFDDWYWTNFYNNPIVGIIGADPTTPAYDENGVWTISPKSVGNPMVPIDMKDRTHKRNNLEGNLGIKLTLFKGLEFTSRISGKLEFQDSKEYQAIYWASPTVYNDQDKLIQRMDKGISYNFQNYLNYQTTIAQKHNISAMIGMEASKWWGFHIGGTRVDMPSTDPNMLYFDKSTNSEATVQFIGGSGHIGANQAYFGRLNYDFMGRYLLTLNVRRDGSSQFHPNYRWGTFPSFSVGWKFAEEEFMRNLTFISTGKLRFGYGQTGANARTGFPYLSQVVTRPEFRYTFDGLATQVGTAPNQIANPALRWESINMSNLGLDMTFFDNRLSFSADLFDKVNDGMILQAETSAIAGTFNGQNPEVNIGSISNKGLEITIGARKNKGELTGSIDLNVSSVRNEVLHLSTDSIRSGAVHNVSPTNLTRIGSPVAQFWGFQLDGMFSKDDPTELVGRKTVITNQPFSYNALGDKVYAQTNARPGDARFKDVNGDGTINDLDKVILGSPLPSLTFGLSINLEYKGFDFTAFFNGTYGNKIMNGSKQYLYNPVGYSNRGKAFADRYRDEVVKDGVVVVTENHDSDIYRISADTYTKMSSFFVEDGSFLRLRNVALGYTVPGSITSKIGVEKLRLYVGGRNLLTFSKYTGLNPEVAGDDIRTLGVDIGLYPVSKMLYFGANITF
jgi:TonB-dependent starch-binding outer membrane protein SusC